MIPYILAYLFGSWISVGLMLKNLRVERQTGEPILVFAPLSFPFVLLYFVANYTIIPFFNWVFESVTHP